MKQFESTVEIKRSPEEIYDFFRRPENFALWFGFTETNDPFEGGAFEVGDRGTSVLRILARRLEISWTIAELDPPRAGTILLDWGDGYGRLRFTLEPAAAGTRFTLTNVIETRYSGVLGAISERMLDAVVRRNTEASAKNLKRLLEA